MQIGPAELRDGPRDGPETKKPRIGLLPAPGALEVAGLSVDLDALLGVDRDGWLEEIGPIRDFYATLGDLLQAELQRQLDGLERRLGEGSR